MLAGAGYLTVIFCIPAHAAIMGVSVEHIGLLIGMANACSVLGAIILHHIIKAYGYINAMAIIHVLSTYACSYLWFNVTDYNSLCTFTAVYCLTAGSILPMYPTGELETSEKESWLLGGTLVIKWAILTTAVAIPVIKVFYLDWAMNYLSMYWMKPAAIISGLSYFSASVGLLVLRFSMSPHLRAKL